MQLCAVHCFARFIEDVMAVLATNGVQTWKQFQSCKLDDIEWTEANNQGKKIFVRMAVKKVKTETQGELVCFLRVVH